MKKVIAIMLALMLSLSLFGCKKDSKAQMENYEIGSDRFPSVTFVLGDREVKESKTDKDGTLYFSYKTEEKGYMDIYEYMSYLIDNCGGVVTSALNEGEEGSCEIAMASEENGFVVTIGFDYKDDEYDLTIKRVAGKIKKTE